MAPDARIVNVKVADESGAVDVSQVLAGIDWVVQHRNDNGINIRVLNLSFGTSSTQSYILDPLAFAAEVAWKSGIVVVASAGNNGAASNGLSDPAYDPFLISVGAADTQGSLNHGQPHCRCLLQQRHAPRAPPTSSPPACTSRACATPARRSTWRYGATATTGTRFFLGSGTSQAAAVVSGAAALILERSTPTQPPTR